MKKFGLSTLAVLLLLPAYCSLPLTSVAAITITVEDQNGSPLSDDVTAEFFDKDGTDLVSIAIDETPSWGNNIHWWAHSRHKTSIKHPKDARRAVRAVLSAPGCAALDVPVAVEKIYEPLSFAPHGGGSAYMYYRFATTVRMTCTPQEKNP